jgi:hypothetical protein
MVKKESLLRNGFVYRSKRTSARFLANRISPKFQLWDLTIEDFWISSTDESSGLYPSFFIICSLSFVEQTNHQEPITNDQ